MQAQYFPYTQSVSLTFFLVLLLLLLLWVSQTSRCHSPKMLFCHSIWLLFLYRLKIFSNFKYFSAWLTIFVLVVTNFNKTFFWLFLSFIRILRSLPYSCLDNREEKRKNQLWIVYSCKSRADFHVNFHNFRCVCVLFWKQKHNIFTLYTNFWHLNHTIFMLCVLSFWLRLPWWLSHLFV